MLMDPRGEAGRLYGAKGAPRIVIDPQGTLINGEAIDDQSAEPADIVTAKSYRKGGARGRQLAKPVTQPTACNYGCTIKHSG